MPFQGGGKFPPTLPPDPIPGWGTGGRVGGGTPSLPGGGGSVASIPSGSPTNVSAFTATDQATVLPIAWGTCKIPATLIEKLAPLQVQPPAWSVNPVHLGEIWSANGSAYECVSPGNASNAPSGSGSAPVAWTASTSVPSGAIRQSNSNVYRSLNSSTATTGVTAPNFTFADFNDGGVHWAFVGAMPLTIVTDGAVVWRYIQQLPCPLYYQFFVAAVCEGEIVGIISTYWDKTQIASAPGGLFLGHILQAYFGPDAGGQGLVDPRFDTSGYQHTALVSTAITSGAPSGTQAEIPDLAFETQAVMFGRAVGVNPADILTEVLTHSRRGREWPSSRVDTSVGGAGASSFRTYCDAKGIEISYLLDTSRASLDVITDLMYAANSVCFMGQGKLKVVPLDDAPIASPAIGAVAYVPNLTASFTVTPDDLLDVVQYSRRKDADCYNSIPIEYQDRGQGYATNRVENAILSDARKRGGIVRGSTITLPFIFADGTIPIYLSRTYAQQSLYNRNTYTVKVGPRFVAVEPGDVGFIPVGEGIVNGVNNYSLRPVRVIQVDEDTPNGDWTLTCVDSPPGAAGSVPYAPAKGDGVNSNFALTIGSIQTAYQAAQQTNQGADNLWPNPTSENSPPSYVTPLNDNSLPEWDYRANLAGACVFVASISGTTLTVTSIISGTLSGGQRLDGAGIAPGTYTHRGIGGTISVTISQTAASTTITASGAAGGDWTRQLSFTNVTSQVLATETSCAATERFSLFVQAKTTGSSNRAIITIDFLDSNGTILSGSVTSFITGTQPDWKDLFVATGDAPLGSVHVRFSLSGFAGLTSGIANFDNIVARRIVAPLNVASGLVAQGLVTDSTGATVWAGDSSWTAPTLASISNAGGGNQTIGFKIDPNGRVFLRGVGASVAGTTAGTGVFNLPSGYRPTAVEIFESSDSAAGSIRIDIQPGGAVVVQTALSAGEFISFSGISFSTT